MCGCVCRVCVLRIDVSVAACKNAFLFQLFLCFPEPVLVKRSFLYINGLKGAFSAPEYRVSAIGVDMCMKRTRHCETHNTAQLSCCGPQSEACLGKSALKCEKESILARCKIVSFVYFTPARRLLQSAWPSRSECDRTWTKARSISTFPMLVPSLSW